jgi:hypothetical protein
VSPVVLFTSANGRVKLIIDLGHLPRLRGRTKPTSCAPRSEIDIPLGQADDSDDGEDGHAAMVRRASSLAAADRSSQPRLPRPISPLSSSSSSHSPNYDDQSCRFSICSSTSTTSSSSPAQQQQQYEPSPLSHHFSLGSPPPNLYPSRFGENSQYQHRVIADKPSQGWGQGEGRGGRGVAGESRRPSLSGAGMSMRRTQWGHDAISLRLEGVIEKGSTEEQVGSRGDRGGRGRLLTRRGSGGVF